MKKYIHKKEGFTLIEMMVVIAVVAILSAAVLAGLAPSRNKAKDSRIISGVQQARAVVEGLYDPFSGGYPVSEPAAAVGYASVEADVVKLNTTGLTYTASGGSFAISASLASGGSYCVDSAGTVNNGTSGSGSCGEATAVIPVAGTSGAGTTVATCASYTTEVACDANAGGANLPRACAWNGTACENVF